MSDAAIDIETVRWEGADGVMLAADVAGDPTAQTVLLFHGGGQTRHSWGGTLRALVGRGYHVASVDLRGHGDSDWSPGGNYDGSVFPDDVELVARRFDRPVLVGASLGGTSALMAVHQGRERDGRDIAGALVLVDVAPNIEPEGVNRIRSFMHEHIETGFGSLDEVADAIQAYNPHRPRPTNLAGLEKNVRFRDGRWYWHWDPAFMWGKHADSDETRMVDFEQRSRALEAAATRSHDPDAARPRSTERPALRGGRPQSSSSFVPHARVRRRRGCRSHGRRRPQRRVHRRSGRLPRSARLIELQPSMHTAAIPVPTPTPTALARRSLNSTARLDEYRP